MDWRNVIAGWADYGEFGPNFDPLRYLHEDQVTAMFAQTLSRGRYGAEGEWPMRTLLSSEREPLNGTPSAVISQTKRNWGIAWHPLMPKSEGSGGPDLLLVDDRGVLRAVIENKVDAKINERVTTRPGVCPSQLCQYVYDVKNWTAQGPKWARGLDLHLSRGGASAVRFLLLSAKAPAMLKANPCLCAGQDSWEVISYDSWYRELEKWAAQCILEKNGSDARRFRFLMNLLHDSTWKANRSTPNGAPDRGQVVTPSMLADFYAATEGSSTSTAGAVLSRIIAFFCRAAESDLCAEIDQKFPDRQVSFHALGDAVGLQLRMPAGRTTALLGIAPLSDGSTRGYYPLDAPAPMGLLIVRAGTGREAERIRNWISAHDWLQSSQPVTYQQKLECSTALRSAGVQAGRDLTTCAVARFHPLHSPGSVRRNYRAVLMQLTEELAAL